MTAVRYSSDKTKNCKYCFWGSQRGNCKRRIGCYYRITETPVTRVQKKDECYKCCYSRDTPCIGFCMRKILGQIGGK